MVNRIWPTVVTGKADSVSSVSASVCHIGGQILSTLAKFCYSTVLHTAEEKESLSFNQIFYFNKENIKC